MPQASLMIHEYCYFSKVFSALRSVENLYFTFIWISYANQFILPKLEMRVHMWIELMFLLGMCEPDYALASSPMISLRETNINLSYCDLSGNTGLPI